MTITIDTDGEPIVTLTSLGDEDERFDFTVDRRGKFAIEALGRTFTADTLRGVVEDVRKAQRKNKVKLDIEVTLVDDGRLTDGVVTGVHGGTGNIIVKPADGGPAIQLTGYSSRGDVMKRMTEGDKAAYLSHLADENRASKLKRSVLDHYRFEGGVRQIIDQEVAAKIDG